MLIVAILPCDLDKVLRMPVAVEIPFMPARVDNAIAPIALVCRSCERVYRLAPSALSRAGVRCLSCDAPREGADRAPIRPWMV